MASTHAPIFQNKLSESAVLLTSSSSPPSRAIQSKYGMLLALEKAQKTCLTKLAALIIEKVSLTHTIKNSQERLAKTEEHVGPLLVDMINKYWLQKQKNEIEKAIELNKKELDTLQQCEQIERYKVRPTYQSLISKTSTAAIPNNALAINRIIISFGQALLLLINKHKDNALFQDKLKRIYLNGVKSESDKNLVLILFSQDSYLNSQYKISFEFKVIDEDPTRRYFETHLAFYTLISSIKKIEFSELKNYYDSQINLIPMSMSDIRMSMEYDHYISKITDNIAFKNLDVIEKDKLVLIQKLTYLPIKIKEFKFLPLNIYNDIDSMFVDEHRGRRFKSFQLQVLSRHLGIMRNYMPLPTEDWALEDKISTRLSEADRSAYISDAEWIKQHHASLIHPFSNSISGTMLLQLRTMRYLINCNSNLDIENINDFFKCFSSLMLFNTSGHSLFEIFEVLMLPEIQEAFTCVLGFSQLTLLELFYIQNKDNFNRSLEETLAYNEVILNKRKLHTEVEKQGRRESKEEKKEIENPMTLSEQPDADPQSVSQSSTAIIIKVTFPDIPDAAEFKRGQARILIKKKGEEKIAGKAEDINDDLPDAIPGDDCNKTSMPNTLFSAALTPTPPNVVMTLQRYTKVAAMTWRSI